MDASLPFVSTSVSGFESIYSGQAASIGLNVGTDVVGPILLSNVLNWGLYGVLMLQVYLYLTTKPRYFSKKLSRRQSQLMRLKRAAGMHTDGGDIRGLDLDFGISPASAPNIAGTLTNLHPLSLNESNSHSFPPKHIPYHKQILVFTVSLLFLLQTVQLVLGTIYLYFIATATPNGVIFSSPLHMNLIVVAACIIGPIVFILSQYVIAYRIYLICTVPFLTAFSRHTNQYRSKVSDKDYHNQLANSNHVYHIKTPFTPNSDPITNRMHTEYHSYPPVPPSPNMGYQKSVHKSGLKMFWNRNAKLLQAFSLWSVFLSLVLAVGLCGVVRGAQLIHDSPTFEAPIPLTPTAGFWLVGTVCINLVVFVYLLVSLVASGALTISKPTTLCLRILGESGFAQFVLSIVALAYAIAGNTTGDQKFSTSSTFAVFLLLPAVYSNTLLLNLSHSYAHTALRSPYGAYIPLSSSSANSTAVSPTASIPLTMIRKSNSKSQLRYRPDQEWNCTPRGNGIFDRRIGSDTEKDSYMYRNAGDAFHSTRRRRSVSRVTAKNPSSRFNFVAAAFSRPVLPRPESRRMSQTLPMIAVGDSGTGGEESNKKRWPWKIQDQFRGRRRKESDLEGGLGNIAPVQSSNGVAANGRPGIITDSDGIITLDLRKMSDEHEKRQSRDQRRAENDVEAEEDGRSLTYKFRKPAPSWVERQRDVLGSGSGHPNGLDGNLPNKSSSEADTYRREDPSTRRKPKGPRSSVAGTSFNTTALKELKSHGSIESFDSLPVFRARPGYGSGSDWDTDYDEDFWSENEEDVGWDVDPRFPIQEEQTENDSTWSTRLTQDGESIMQQTGLSWIPAHERPNFRSLMSLPNPSLNSRAGQQRTSYQIRQPAGGPPTSTADDSSVMIISAVPEPSFVEPSMFRAASVAATRASTGSEFSSWTYPKPTALPDLDEDLQNGGYVMHRDGEKEDSTRVHASNSTPSGSNGIVFGPKDPAGERNEESGNTGRRWRVHPLKRMVEMGRLRW